MIIGVKGDDSRRIIGVKLVIIIDYKRNKIVLRFHGKKVNLIKEIM